LIAVPLVARGRGVGTLVLIRTEGSARYGPADLFVAQEFGRRAALAIENARLYRLSQEATRARDDLLGIVAHDLRSPLVAIGIQAEVLLARTPEGEGKTRHAIDGIKRSAARMNRLIQDLLDVTRIEAGRLSIEPRQHPTAAVIADALETQRAITSAAGFDVRLDLPPELPDVIADRDRLLQVFENLIGNAIKFAPAGGRITIGAAVRGPQIVFRVADNGPGIPAEGLAHLFDRFWQANHGDRRGAGLGLPIVKGIVEAHGGRIWVESAPGRGSTFFFTIPAAVAPLRFPAGVDTPAPPER
jgi:signal transduction histidine kinase